MDLCKSLSFSIFNLIKLEEIIFFASPLLYKEKTLPILLILMLERKKDRKETSLSKVLSYLGVPILFFKQHDHPIAFDQN